MLKLSKIGKLTKKFASTCCYNYLTSPILAASNCRDFYSEGGKYDGVARPMRLPQHVGLQQLGRNDVRCCMDCSNINDDIWTASKKSSLWVPDTATPWFEQQRLERIKAPPSSLTEKCKLYGITSYQPPADENLQLKVPLHLAQRQRLNPNRFKRISPEFFELLKKHDEAMMKKDPLYGLPAHYLRPPRRRRYSRVNSPVPSVYPACPPIIGDQVSPQPRSKSTSSRGNYFCQRHGNYDCWCWKKEESQSEEILKMTTYQKPWPRVGHRNVGPFRRGVIDSEIEPKKSHTSSRANSRQTSYAQSRSASRANSRAQSQADSERIFSSREAENCYSDSPIDSPDESTAETQRTHSRSNKKTRSRTNSRSTSQTASRTGSTPRTPSAPSSGISRKKVSCSESIEDVEDECMEPIKEIWIKPNAGQMRDSRTSIAYPRTEPRTAFNRVSPGVECKKKEKRESSKYHVTTYPSVKRYHNLENTGYCKTDKELIDPKTCRTFPRMEPRILRYERDHYESRKTSCYPTTEPRIKHENSRISYKESCHAPPSSKLCYPITQPRTGIKLNTSECSIPPTRQCYPDTQPRAKRSISRCSTSSKRECYPVTQPRTIQPRGSSRCSVTSVRDCYPETQPRIKRTSSRCSTVTSSRQCYHSTAPRTNRSSSRSCSTPSSMRNCYPVTQPRTTPQRVSSRCSVTSVRDCYPQTQPRIKRTSSRCSTVTSSRQCYHSTAPRTNRSSSRSRSTPSSMRNCYPVTQPRVKRSSSRYSTVETSRRQSYSNTERTHRSSSRCSTPTSRQCYPLKAPRIKRGNEIVVPKICRPFPRLEPRSQFTRDPCDYEPKKRSKCYPQTEPALPLRRKKGGSSGRQSLVDCSCEENWPKSKRKRELSLKRNDTKMVDGKSLKTYPRMEPRTQFIELEQDEDEERWCTPEKRPKKKCKENQTKSMQKPINYTRLEPRTKFNQSYDEEYNEKHKVDNCCKSHIRKSKDRNRTAKSRIPISYSHYQRSHHQFSDEEEDCRENKFCSEMEMCAFRRKECKQSYDDVKFDEDYTEDQTSAEMENCNIRENKQKHRCDQDDDEDYTEVQTCSRYKESCPCVNDDYNDECSTAKSIKNYMVMSPRVGKERKYDEDCGTKKKKEKCYSPTAPSIRRTNAEDCLTNLNEEKCYPVTTPSVRKNEENYIPKKQKKRCYALTSPSIHGYNEKYSEELERKKNKDTNDDNGGTSKLEDRTTEYQRTSSKYNQDKYKHAQQPLTMKFSCFNKSRRKHDHSSSETDEYEDAQPNAQPNVTINLEEIEANEDLAICKDLEAAQPSTLPVKKKKKLNNAKDEHAKCMQAKAQREQQDKDQKACMEECRKLGIEYKTPKKDYSKCFDTCSRHDVCFDRRAYCMTAPTRRIRNTSPHLYQPQPDFAKCYEELLDWEEARCRRCVRCTSPALYQPKKDYSKCQYYNWKTNETRIGKKNVDYPSSSLYQPTPDRSKCLTVKPGHEMCYTDSTDWTSATANYPQRYRDQAIKFQHVCPKYVRHYKPCPKPKKERYQEDQKLSSDSDSNDENEPPSNFSISATCRLKSKNEKRDRKLYEFSQEVRTDLCWPDTEAASSSYKLKSRSRNKARSRPDYVLGEDPPSIMPDRRCNSVMYRP